MRQYLEIRNTSGHPAVGMRVMFTPSRTSLLGYHMMRVPRGVSPLFVHVNPFGAEVMWHPPLPAGAKVVLSLELVGEHLLREHEVWWDTHGAVLTEEEANDPRGKLLIEVSSVWELAQKMIQQKRLYCNTLPQVVESKHSRLHEFFCELDLHTNRNLIGVSGVAVPEYIERVAIIDGMTECLKQRVLGRLEATRTHPGVPAPNLEVWPDEAQIDAISKLQLKIFHKHLEKAPGVLDTQAVWQAFSMFANGQLRVDPMVASAWDAAPLGSALFYFAEFAFMACDVGIDVADWECVLPTLVGIQEIFTHAYRPPASVPQPWRLDDYEQGNFEPGDSMPENDVELVRQKYEAISTNMNQLRIEVGLNAARAFPGDLAGG